MEWTMTAKKCAGFLLGLASAFFVWQLSIASVHFFQDGGALRLHALLFDPDYSLRTIAVMSAFIGGLAALTEKQGGSWLAGFSSSLFLIQVIAMMAGKGTVEAWETQATVLTVMTALFLTLTSTGRKSHDVEDETTQPA